MKSKRLKDILRRVLAEDELKRLVRGYDTVGDVAIIIIPEKLQPLENIIGEALLQSVPKLRAVYRRDGNYSGEFRTIGLKKIAGNGGLETIHREYGVVLYVNPEQAYFSPRSGVERYRVAKKVVSGERVLVMFSGIAPMPLMIGKHGKADEVYGVEKNSQAHSLAMKSLKANRKIKNVHLLCGDVEEVLPTFERRFDRVALPLPQSAEKYLALALRALKRNGWIHFYTFQNRDKFQTSLEKLHTQCDEVGKKVVKSAIIKCGHIAPGKYRICIDASIL